MIKSWRVVLWGIALAGGVVGWALLVRGGTSAALANGTDGVLKLWGGIILGVALSVGMANAVWGLIRWILRWRREHWRAGQVIGKLIGGGIWRILVMAPLVVVSLIWVTPAVNKLILKTTAQDQVREMGAASMLEADFLAGELSADEYVRNLVYATYDVPSLPQKYWSLQYMMPPRWDKLLDEHVEELSGETIELVLRVATLAEINFDENADSNVARAKSVFAEEAFAATSNVKKLNKAKLSAGGNFVVFYTDKGDDAVSDEKVAVLAEMLDDIVQGYKEALGLEYEYEKLVADRVKLLAMEHILDVNGIDKKVLDKAMPVYVANPFKGQSNVLASYAGRRFMGWREKALMGIGSLMSGENGDMARFYTSVPTYPFINILPDNLNNNSLKLVTAHELGHHYTSNYCYREFGKACNDADFIGETLPNYFAVNVVPASEQRIGNLIQTDHHDSYVSEGTCYMISETIPEPRGENDCHKKGSFVGYLPVAFLQNYAEVVPNGLNVMLKALGDDKALSDLYEAASRDEYKQVMTQLVQRNLTNDGYGGRTALKAIHTPYGEEISCDDLCERQYVIEPSSARYLYFGTSEYDGIKVTLTAPGANTVTVLGRQGTQWMVIESHDQYAEYAVRAESDYNTIAFAVANYAIAGDGFFTVEVQGEVFEELLSGEDESEGSTEDSGDSTGWGGGSCLGINFESVLDFPIEMMKIFNGVGGRDYVAAIEQLEQRNSAIKEQLEYRYVTICLNTLKTQTDFDELVRKVRAGIGTSWEFFRVDLGQREHLSMIAAYNLWLDQGKFYFLIQDEMRTQLMRVKMEKKIPDNS